MSAKDPYERLTPETATPTGAVSYAEHPLDVRITLVLLRPTLTYDVDGMALAWTPDAVWVMWRERRVDGERWRTRWVRRERVTRR